MSVPGCDSLNGVTLHSLSLKMLMRNHVLEATGRTARPLNEFEVEALICDLMEAHGGKRAVGRLRKRTKLRGRASSIISRDTPRLLKTLPLLQTSEPDDLSRGHAHWRSYPAAL